MANPPRIGVLGAGQLALMLAQAAPAVGATVICAGSSGDCAAQAATVVEVDLASVAEVSAFARTVDLVTIESENIDASVLAGLNLFPNARAVGIAQDRQLEKAFFHECGLGTAPFASVNSHAELQAALQHTGLPAILKTRRMGYDGKGQFRLTTSTDALRAWESVGTVPCILEGVVPFEAEVSLLAARSRSGALAFYPLVRNHHREGILRTSIVPFEDAALQAQAERHVTQLLQQLDYVGVLAVEFFVADGLLLANEMAPRVHNSGHWTIEGAATSQFEQHLRAILDLPLGPTVSQPMVMLNCIGTMPPLAETAPFASLHRHDYGKDPRPGRKVGHLTFRSDALRDIRTWQQRLANNHGD